MIDITSELSSILALLTQAVDKEYYSHPIPSKIDDKINESLAKFKLYDQEQVNSILEGIVGDNARVLGLFAERMASLAVRESNINRVRHGLLGLIIYSHTVDPRDVLLVLSLLHDAIVKLGEDPKEIFLEFRSLTGDENFLDKFIARNDEDKSIDEMGYEESSNEGGFLYKRTW